MPLLIAGLGVTEVLVILVICVLIFGAKRLPQLGAGLGQGIRNFKSSLTDKDEKPIEESADSKQKS